MKKLVMVIAVMMLIVLMAMTTASKADAYSEASAAIYKYMDESGKYKDYNGHFDETEKSYSYIGFCDTKSLTEDYNITYDWNNVETWFKEWYQEALIEQYPDAEIIGVEMFKEATTDDVEIYNIIVTAKNDLIDYIDGIQKIVKIMAVFY